ncbi:MAG TPA: response regulator, partial [Bacillota bacterium]
MWRAILVDDEEYVRAELAALFPWSRYQFELVGEADNGRAAIDLVNAAKPDLVITDIRMPDMDGLALIARLADVYPQPVVVVVSAYNDFPYVREALRLGAADYLMKAEATLETAAVFLGRLGEILEERYRARNRQAEMTSNIARYHCLAKESFWRDTLTRASDLTELEARANQLGIVLENMRFGLTFVHIFHAPKTDGNNRTA